MTDVAEMVARARRGDREGWRALLDRYSPLVTAVSRHLRLSEPDIEDVRQHVWMKLVEHLPRLRTPEALPGWIVTTARHESYRILRSGRRLRPVDPTESSVLDGDETIEPDRELLRAETRRAVRNGLAELRPRHRELLMFLHSDSNVSYHEASDRLGMPLGSIGPTRSRGLDKLRRTAAVSELMSA